MTGLFDRLATRVAGNPSPLDPSPLDPSGLAWPRVPTRFEALPEEAGFAAPQSAALADDVAPTTEPTTAVAGVGRAPAPALAPAPTQLPPASRRPDAADPLDTRFAAAAHDIPPAGRRADHAGTPPAAIAATQPLAGRPAVVQRRAVDATVSTANDMAPTPLAATASGIASAYHGRQPPVASIGAPATAVPVPSYPTKHTTTVNIARPQPAVEPPPHTAAIAPGRVVTPGRIVPRAGAGRRVDAAGPHTNDLAGEISVTSGTVAISAAVTRDAPDVATDAAPKRIELRGIENASPEHGSQNPPSAARGTAIRPATNATPPLTSGPRAPTPATTAPIIEIHIGSVEIRAMPQSAPPTASPGPAARSLDDFLVGRRVR